MTSLSFAREKHERKQSEDDMDSKNNASMESEGDTNASESSHYNDASKSSARSSIKASDASEDTGDRMPVFDSKRSVDTSKGSQANSTASGDDEGQTGSYNNENSKTSVNISKSSVNNDSKNSNNASKSSVNDASHNLVNSSRKGSINSDSNSSVNTSKSSVNNKSNNSVNSSKSSVQNKNEDKNSTTNAEDEASMNSYERFLQQQMAATDEAQPSYDYNSNNNSKRSVDTSKSSSSTSKSSSSTSKSSVNTSKSSVNTSKSSVNTSKDSVDTSKSSANNNKRSIKSNDSTTSGGPDNEGSMTVPPPLSSKSTRPSTVDLEVDTSKSSVSTNKRSIKSNNSTTSGGPDDEGSMQLPPPLSSKSTRPSTVDLEEGESNREEQTFMKQDEFRPVTPNEPGRIDTATTPNQSPLPGTVTPSPRAPTSFLAPDMQEEEEDASILKADMKVMGSSVASGSYKSSAPSIPPFGGGVTYGRAASFEERGAVSSGNYHYDDKDGDDYTDHDRDHDRDLDHDIEKEELEEQQKSEYPQKTASGNEKGGTGYRRNAAMILAILCCVAILAGIGAAVGVALGGKDKNAVIPPLTTAPAMIQPTETPTKTPTASPTPVPIASNDDCTGATVLVAGMDFVATTTTGTTTGEVGVSDIATTCGGVDGDGPGIWFYFEGNGVNMTVSTCGEETVFDTKLSVYTGDCESAALTCFATDDDSCGVASSVTWNTVPGEQYFILLRGLQDGQGTFRMTVTENPPENDVCTGAVLLEPTGEIYLGNSQAATVDKEMKGVCGDTTAVEITGPGVWFKFLGTGSELIVSSCSGTAFDTKLAVYTAVSQVGASGATDAQICFALDCVAFNDDSCGLRSEITFKSVAGQMYYVMLHGYLDEVGQYGMALATRDNLYNNYCGDAREAKIGIPTNGSTALADFDFTSVVTCGAVNIEGPSVWYLVYGTGTPLLVSTCSPQTNYDTQISVFTGGCASLLCVGGNDDSVDETCGGTSEFVFSTEAFTEYLVIVHGFGNETGDFELSFEALGDRPVLNDPCEAVGSVPFNWDPVIGSTATSATIGAGLSGCVAGVDPASTLLSVQGEWYFVKSDGGLLNVSVCEFNTNNTQVTIFQAEVSECAALTCNTTSGTVYGNGCAYSWETTRNTVYHILVYTPSGRTGGEYGMTVTSTGPPTVENDNCTSATPLVIGAPAVLGTTFGATIFDVGLFCGVEATSPTVWFSVIGNGRDLLASLCGYTTFDTKISVYASSDGSCATLECLGGDDDSCELQSSYSWSSLENTRYYIMIHGFADTTGDYGITVS